MRGLYTRAGPGAGARHTPPALDRSGRTGPGQPRTAPEPVFTAVSLRFHCGFAAVLARGETAAKPRRNRGETARNETAHGETAP